MPFVTKDGYIVEVGTWLYDGTEIREVTEIDINKGIVYAHDIKYDENGNEYVDETKTSMITRYEVGRMYAKW